MGFHSHLENPAGVLVHRATRPLRGSVSCGSGWSVPCVSIQLTLSQFTRREGPFTPRTRHARFIIMLATRNAYRAHRHGSESHGNSRDVTSRSHDARGATRPPSRAHLNRPSFDPSRIFTLFPLSQERKIGNARGNLIENLYPRRETLVRNPEVCPRPLSNGACSRAAPSREAQLGLLAQEWSRKLDFDRG